MRTGTERKGKKNTKMKPMTTLQEGQKNGAGTVRARRYGKKLGRDDTFISSVRLSVRERRASKRGEDR